MPLNRFEGHNPRLSHQLPQDFSPRLQEIDVMLANCADRSPVPTGLAERVFAQSVAGLPQATVHTGSRLRFVPAAPVLLHQTRWARLAMAASVAILCSASVMLFHSSKTAYADASGSLLAALDHHSSTAQYESNFGYLFDTMDSTSDELRSELTWLVASR